MQQKNSQVVIEGVKTPEQEAKEKAMQELMQEYNYEFKENVKGILERLEKKIPFKKIDIENLDLENKIAQNSRQSSSGFGQRQDQKPDGNDGGNKQEFECPLGIMKDQDYDYCYRNLLIETKEWYTTLKNLSDYLNGKQDPVKTKAKPKKKVSKADDKGGNPADDTPQPRCVTLKETMDQKTKLQSFKVLSFSNENNMGEFMQFLAEHLSFTEKMIHLTILIGDLVEQSIRYTNLQEFENNNKRDEELSELLEQWRLSQQQLDEDQQEPGMPTPNESQKDLGITDEQKRPTNSSYKFMHINQLENFKQNYIKSVSQLIMRMYKSVYSIYKLYPEFNAFEHLSIFDKVYQLQMISHSFGQYQVDNLQELERMQLPQLFDFEEKAQTLLKDGGIKNKDLEIIQKTSREIRDQIDSKLEHAYISHNIWPDFFISSVSFSEIWCESIINDHQPNQKFKFKVGLDVIKMAFQKHLGGNTEGVLSDEAFDLYRSFLPIEEEVGSGYKTVKLIDLVNFSDFIEFHQILKLFCQDQTEACLAQIKKEKSIVQELYNQNFTYQKSQTSGGFVAAASNKNQIDLDGQANNLNQVSDIISFPNTRCQIAHGGEDGIPGDKQLLQKAVYLRTVRHLGSGDFALMYFMTLFGVRQILNDEFKYALFMNEKIKKEKIIQEQGTAEMQKAFQAKIDNIMSKTSGEAEGPEEEEAEQVVADEGSVESFHEKLEKSKTMAAKVVRNMDDPQKDEGLKPKQKRKLKPGMTVMLGDTQGGSLVSDFASNDSSQKVKALSPNNMALTSKKTLKSLGTQNNVKLKKVQIITEEDDGNTQEGRGNKSSGTTGRGYREFSSQFMKDLTHEESNLLGLDSILQVNEVFERFNSGEHVTQPVEPIQHGANSQMLMSILNGDYGDAEVLASVKASPEDLAELEHHEALKSHNRLDDVLTGSLQKTLQKIDARLKNQVGETFGSYSQVMKDEEFEGFNPSRDRGYMLYFEGEAEAKFLTNNFIFQKLMQGSQFFNQEQDDPLGNTYRMNENYPEKNAPKDKYNQYGFEIRKEKPWAVLPCFIPFSRIVTNPSKPDRLTQQRILEFFMFRDFSTFLQKSHIKQVAKNADDIHQEINIPPPDLNVLKNYILHVQKMHYYTRKEMLQQVQQFKMRKIVGKRFFDIFTKLSAISTDGFQREQHVIKIQHWTDEVNKAQQDLLREEKFVESGALLQQDEQNLSESIQRITTLMINIEKWTAQKIQMEETLKAEEQDWIQNDTIYKQRRIILNYIIRLNLDMSYDAHASLVVSKMNEDARNLSGQAYELVFFMIQHILMQNRMPSINFMAEINQFINSQQEEMSQLNKTQFELTSKVLAIEEEKREMRKKIDEMKQVCDLKEQKDTLIQENAAQEIRIAQLRKQLGKGNKAAEPANAGSDLK